MDDMVTLQLQSCTVFWTDIDLNVSPSPTYMSKNHVSPEDAYKAWQDQVEPWLRENISGGWNVHSSGVWFALRHDALMFKLHWTPLIHYWYKG